MDPLDAYARFLHESKIFLWGQRDDVGRPYTFSLRGARDGRVLERLSHFYAKLIAARQPDASPSPGPLAMWSPVVAPPLAWLVAQNLWSEFHVDTVVSEDAPLWILDSTADLDGEMVPPTLVVALDPLEKRENLAQTSIWSLGDVTAIVTSLTKQQLIPAAAEDGLRRYLLAAALRD